MVTVITKTIGPTGRDFATFTLAEAAAESVATAAFGGTNLVTADGAIVFEADAGTYAESFVCNFALTCDAHRNVSFRSAAGGQAIVSSSAGGPVIQLTDAAFTALHGLKVVSTSTAGSARGVELFPASGKTCEGCLLDSLTIESTATVNFFAIELQLEGSGAAGGVGSTASPTVIQNCVEQGIGNGLSIVGGKTDEIHAKVVNCTFAGSGFNTINVVTANDVTIQVVNCINLGHTTNYRDGSSSGTVTPSGSNNFGTSNNAFPVAMQGTPYPITATTNVSPGSGDFAIFDASSGQLVDSANNDVANRGVGPSSSSVVPTTGIAGGTRSGTTTQPGAFATLFVAPPVVPLAIAGESLQTLPKNETFEKPDWAASTVGSAQNHCLPWFFQYASWNLSNSLDTSDSEYASCPFKTGGALECSDFGLMYTPDPSLGSALGLHITDKHGAGQTKMRGFVCREEDTFNRDDLSIEAEFGLDVIGTALLGNSQAGTGGSSPGVAGVISYPTSDTSGSSSDENTTLAFNSEGNTFGSLSPIDPIAVPGGDGWLGNAVAVRVGGGRPTLTSNPSSATASASWSWRRLDGYVFAAYPVKVSASQVDLHLELWRFNTTASNTITPRLLAKNVVTSGAANLRKDVPHRLRVEVENVGGNPVLECFIAEYEQAGVFQEMTAFGTGAFTGGTVTSGPSGDATVSADGKVTDSGASKIAAFTDKTVAIFCGRDRSIDVTPYSTGASPVMKNIVEGVNRITGRSLTPDAIIYNDLFERVPTANASATNVDEFVQGLFSFGWNTMGMFLFDVATANDQGAGATKTRRSLRWTDSPTSVANPTDYVTHMYDADPTNNGSVENVARWLWHRRPSSFLFNHHRVVKVKGAVDPSSSTGTPQTFVVGVSCRGSVSQIFHDVIVANALYTTDGNGNQTSLKLRISRWNGSFLVNYAAGETVLAEKVIHSSGSPPSGYDIGGRSSSTTRNIGLRIQNSAQGGSEYTMSWDGTNVTFDTFFEDCVQDAASKVVFHPAPPPTTTQGRAEGMVFVSTGPKEVSGTSQYDDPRWEDWTEGTVDADDSVTEGASIAVGGEGTPSVNLKTVIDVDWTVEVVLQRPKYTAAFASGHRYTSPIYGRSRRIINARAENVPKDKFDSLVTFYNARKGITDPFFFDFPIPATLGSNTLTTISVIFTSSGLKVRRKMEDVYSVELELVEVFT